MPENEEIIEDNGGGGEETVEQVAVEQPVRWEIVPDAETAHTPIADAFKVVPEVEKVIDNTPTAEQIEADRVLQEAEAETLRLAEEEKANTEYIEMTEDYAIKYLADKKGMTVDEFQDSLKPKEQEKLDGELEAYLKFKKETNRSFADWQETQKDFSQEPKEKVLLHNLKLENPTLDDKQIKRLFDREYAYDAEDDDEDTILDKQINIEKDYQKGLAKLEEQKEQYKAVRGSDELVPDEYKSAKELVDNWNKQQEENKIAFEQTQQDFQSKTDNVFSKDFEGFKVKVGENEFKVKPENVELAKKNLSDLSNFDKKFFDETGKLKDPEGYYRALHFADNPDKIAEHFINIGKALQVEADEKESKNIQTIGQANRITPLATSGKKWTIEK